ncbi:MAG: transposase [Terriglobales bacterium]
MYNGGISHARSPPVKIQMQKPLFAWDCLEDHPVLATIKQLLEAIPDGKLVEGLEAARGKGRNDYPVRTLWGVVLLTIALRHAGFEACLGELRRNPVLAKLIGIGSADEVPNGWNVSRFLDVVGQEPHRVELEAIFNQMIQRLGEVVPDLGQVTAGDSTALQARRRRCDRPQTQEEHGKEGEAVPASPARDKPEKIELDRHGLPQPSGGRKEYKDDKGNVTKVVEWFGYKLHLLVDAKHEVALVWRVSSTKAGDNELLPELVDQGRANLPKGRMHSLAYDKAADTVDAHEKLHACGIKAVIQNRALWKEEQEKLLPGHDGNSNIVYDEAGTLYCYDRVSTPMIRRPMAYIGHERSRGTLKYRCPAMHDGLPCAMSEICNAGKRYGLTIRVKQEIDLRRFPPIPRATKQFERLYKGRTSVERVNARLKIFWGLDDGNVTGATRFYAMVGAVMLVHAAFATLLAAAPRREGTLGKMRLSPIAKALHERITAASPVCPRGARPKARRGGGTKQRRLFAA